MPRSRGQRTRSLAAAIASIAALGVTLGLTLPLLSLALADDRPLLEALRAVDVPLVPHAIAPREEAQGAYEEALQRHLSRAAGLFG